MSIYATLWKLKFPRHGDFYIDCDWIEVRAQGVPPHIGSPTPGNGYENGDPYGSFLPPPFETDEEGTADFMRAVVFVTEGTRKGTPLHHQQYPDPLLVLTGEEYAHMAFDELHTRICDALRGDRPRLVGQWLGSDGETRLIVDGGVSKEPS